MILELKELTHIHCAVIATVALLVDASAAHDQGDFTKLTAKLQQHEGTPWDKILAVRDFIQTSGGTSLLNTCDETFARLQTFCYSDVVQLNVYVVLIQESKILDRRDRFGFSIPLHGAEVAYSCVVLLGCCCITYFLGSYSSRYLLHCELSRSLFFKAIPA